MNEKEKFATNLRRILIEKGYEPKASVIEREFNLRHYGKPIGLHAVARWLRLLDDVGQELMAHEQTELAE